MNSRHTYTSFERSTFPDRSSSAGGAEAVRPRIVILFPRGEAIRNFAYAGTLDTLAKTADVYVLTVPTTPELDELLRSKCKEVFELEEFEDKWIVRIQRELIDMAHGRWLWSRASQERWRLRDSEAVTVRQKLTRLGKKILSRPFSNRSGLNLLSKMERVSSRRFRTTDHYLDLLRTIGPDLVFNASQVHSKIATQAVEAAQWLEIPTATFIFSWDNLTSQGRINLPYDHFVVWNEDLKDQLVSFYDSIERGDVVVTGTPQFDFHFRPEIYQSREEYCEGIGADPNTPLVLYTTGMANHMPDEPSIVEGIADMLATSEHDPKPQLVLRVYAKDLTGRFDGLRKRRTDIVFAEPSWDPNWFTPTREDAATLVNALRHCAVGINVASTVSLELCMFDKPVINVGYNPASVSKNVMSYADYYEFDHYKPVVDSGAVQVAYSADQMEELLNEAFVQPAKFTKERRSLINKMFGETLDGSSATRVANVLLEFCKRSETK